MLDLKTAITAEAEARAQMQAINERLNEAHRARDKTAADLAALESNLEGAAQRHAEAVAAIELGEEADTDATAAELEKARAALAGEADLRQEIRKQSAIVDALHTRYLSAHAAHGRALNDLKAAKVETLQLRAKEAVLEAERMTDALADKGAELMALSGLLSEQGAPWQGGFVYVDRVVTPPADVVAKHRAAMLAEFNQATA